MLLGTRPEEQDVGPKATDIMSGVFEVFVNLTQVLAGDPRKAPLQQKRTTPSVGHPLVCYKKEDNYDKRERILNYGL
jgi:hypothetical protein